MAEERLQEIREARLNKRKLLLEKGLVPYPSEARRSHVIQMVLDNFAELVTEKTPIILAGRVMAVRRHGGVTFANLKDLSAVMQLQFTRESGEEQYALLEYLDAGDFIQVSGVAVESKRGEKTLQITAWNWLTKSIRPLPTSWYGLKDQEARLRQREIDFIFNEKAEKIIATRSQVIDWLRQRLQTDGFLEVETPILQALAGGAAAKPFKTFHNTLKQDLYLRIAPELFLKRLLVGGFEMVFEIGRNFRNEGVDREHNPEFTMCEFYWSMADYEDLMVYTEKIISQLVAEIMGGLEVTWQEKKIKWASPWRKIKYVELFKEKIGIDIMAEKDVAVYEKTLKEHKLAIPAIKTYPKLVDELYKELIRPTLIQPTLLYDYPVELAPLAKTAVINPRIAEKFQLVVGGMEIVNAYTELNDPVEQRKRFEEQQQQRKAGDEEAAAVDEDYLRAMEYGMPPAAGWGLGIDRLVALLTDAANIRETIAFPLLKSSHD